MIDPSATHAIRKRFSVLPNLITTGSLFFGLLAIFYTFERMIGDYADPLKWACWYILISAVLDALDGKIARMTGSESEFGGYYDSLADVIVFGVAPAMLMYSHLRSGPNIRLAEMSCIFYTICGAIRLARFNVQSGAEEHTSFTGLPIPGAAAMVVSCYLVATIHEIAWTLAYVPFLMIILAFLMVSRIRYASLKSVDVDASKNLTVLVGFVFFLAVVVALARYKEWVILALTTVYVASGPVLALMSSWRRTTMSHVNTGTANAGDAANGAAEAGHAHGRRSHKTSRGNIEKIG